MCLSNSMHPANGLCLCCRIQQWFNKYNMLGCQKIEAIGSMLDQEQQHLNGSSFWLTHMSFAIFFDIVVVASELADGNM